ncbi:hypothetical protein BC343_11765 [Mucilaginibacter pedocola]|uniref:CAAX protease n=2 Tax=Mucilaginibacter pedocola TaxID=1792845 RepID=A0A1S9PBE7_9SPHI|nr:hypothetical protein BC343_11765 [Mucilaginibacter pedocola]
MYHLQANDGSHQFKDGTTFDDIIDTYTFDKKLRYLTASYLERIEVAMRILLTNTYSAKHDFYWYTEAAHYSRLTPPEDVIERVEKGEMEMPRKYLDTHAFIMAEVKENFDKSTELFIKKFQSKYTAERLPPSNMAMEILSMGKIARLYDALVNSAEKQAVASGFGIPHLYLSSWFLYLTNIRNICAHHGRLWNRRTTADRFKVPERKEFKFSGTIDENFNTCYYGTLSIMIRLLNVINPEHSLVNKFQALIAEYPKINLGYMGFPAGWEKTPAWV